MEKALRNWISVSLLNLLIVSLLGVIMRYKIAYSFPFLQQKFILHAHSHFAFAGWISQVLMALMVAYLYKHNQQAFKQYRVVLYANLVTAYGMLFSFPVQGYGAVSITFSTLNILTAYWFAVKFWRSLDSLPAKANAHSWFKASLVFNVISSLGAFALAYMMATKNLHQNWYLAAVYFFLHFQYNGWFFFASMGLFSGKLQDAGANLSFMRGVFLLFALACVPAYFLSALWLPIPTAVYIVVVIAAVLQVVAGFALFRGISEQKQVISVCGNTLGNRLMVLAAVALAIKLLLQLGSTIPSLSDLAFGFRPIVIGYLHLALLAVITLFIIGYIIAQGFLPLNNTVRWSVIAFTGGIILNQLLLMSQGLAAMTYVGIPYMDKYLLAAGVAMFLSLLMLNIGGRRKNRCS